MDANGYTTLLKLTTPTADITTGNVSTLNVSGVSTLNGNVNAKSALTVTGKTTSNGGLEVVGTSNLKGNTSVTGTLSSTGKATLNSLEVTNASTLKGTLSVTGASTLTGKLTANGSIGTTSLTISSTITSSGLITANKGATVKGAVLDAQAGTKTTTLTATGKSTLAAVDAGSTTVDRLYFTTISEFNGRPKATFETIKLYNVDANGTTTFIGGNGATIVGGGEAAQELYNAYNSTKNAYGDDGIYNSNNRPGAGYWSSDNLVLTADGTVYIHSNVQGNYNNRKEWIFSSNGSLTAPGNITTSGSISASSLTTSGKVTSGSLDTGPITASAITSSGNISANNFTGKWNNYTNSIGTKVTPTSSSNVIIKK